MTKMIPSPFLYDNILLIPQNMSQIMPPCYGFLKIPLIVLIYLASIKYTSILSFFTSSPVFPFSIFLPSQPTLDLIKTVHKLK